MTLNRTAAYLAFFEDVCYNPFHKVPFDRIALFYIVYVYRVSRKPEYFGPTCIPAGN